MRDLGDTFQRNRALTQAEKERAAQQRLNEEMMGLRKREHEDTLGLRRDELAGQTADRSDARENRKLALDSQIAHQKKIEQYQAQLAAAKDEEGKWRVLESMGKEGMLTEDGIEQMNQAFSEKLGKVGIGVKMFKLPTPEDNAPRSWKDPETGAPFVYNRRTGNFEKSENPNSVTMSEEIDDVSGEPKRKITRKMSPADLEKAMAAEAAAKAAADEEAAAAAGPTLQQQGEIEEILQRPGIPAGGKPQRKAGLEGAPAAVQPGGNVIGPGVFATEEAARAAGHKAPDVVRLYINGEAKRVRLK